MIFQNCEIIIDSSSRRILLSSCDTLIDLMLALFGFTAIRFA